MSLDGKRLAEDLLEHAKVLLGLLISSPPPAVNDEDSFLQTKQFCLVRLTRVPTSQPSTGEPVFPQFHRRFESPLAQRQLGVSSSMPHSYLGCVPCHTCSIANSEHPIPSFRLDSPTPNTSESWATNG